MNIKRLDPSGILRPELSGISALEALPPDWFGYANLFIKFGRWDEPAEIDVLFVTHDRIFLIDLKNWVGTITANNATWYQQRKNDPVRESRGASSARKLAYAKRRFTTLMSQHLGLAHQPVVEQRVLFTHDCDINELEKEDFDNGAMKMKDFLHSVRGKNYDETFRFQRSSVWSRAHPLTEGDPKKLLMKFFGDREHFQPKQLSFDGYRPKDLPSFTHPKGVYDEFECEYIEEPSYLALLRYWNFANLPTATHVAAERRDIAAREHSVLNLIRRIDDDLYSRGVLKWKNYDRDYNMRYWELFEIERTMRRLKEFLAIVDLQPNDRIDLASRILGRAAQLHRHQIAHRDIGPHTVWIDQAKTSVILSAFTCAHYPATTSLKDIRVRLIAASTRLPEDDVDLGVPKGTPFQQDVFLLGALLWSFLVREELPNANGIPDVQSANISDTQVSSQLADWFRKSLDLEPSERWSTAVEMHDAFVDIVRRQLPPPEIATSLASFHRENPYMTYRVREEIKDDRATVYISGAGDNEVVVKVWATSGDGVDTASELRSFLRAADALQTLRPRHVQQIVDFGLYRNDVFLVSRVVKGESLEAVRARYNSEQLLAVCEQLVVAVVELHQLDVWHGDLNLQNVLVSVEQSKPGIFLIDLPTFDSSDVQTPAFSPPMPCDGFTKDRFAVCKIIQSLLANVRDGGPMARGLLDAIKQCEQGPAPWLTLEPLLAKLPKPEEKLYPHLDIRIGVSNRNQEGQLLADDGRFHVFISDQSKTLSIVGFDSSIELAIDHQTSKPRSAIVRNAAEPFINVAAKHAAITFEGAVVYYPSSSFDIGSLLSLLELPEVEEALERLGPPASVPSEKVELKEPQAEAAPLRSIDVDTLWRKILEIEEDDVLEATVTGQSSYDSINGVCVIPCEFSRADIDFDPEDRPVIYMNEYRLGDLDLDRMTTTELAARNVRGGVMPAPGARLRIATVQDMDNFNRRKSAIERILDDRCLIPGLIRYFASSTEAQPIVVRGEDIPESTLDSYKLNETQKLAFRQLWRLGPVGLLQGPPGTGKTTFIAAFVHYAITQGGANNVLLLSQSHKAVDNAIERLLKTFGDHPVSLIRVGQLAKVSTQVSHYHSRAVHEQYHDLFEAEAKLRIATLAKQMGLPEDYARETFEFWSKLRAHESILLDPSAENDEDGKVRAQYSAAKRYVSHLAETLNLPPDSSVQVVFDRLLPALAQTQDYMVNNPDLVRRFRQLMNLSIEWLDALEGDRTLEPFLVKSRQVVSGTCVGVGHRILRVDEVPFDLVVIDEAAKCGPGDLAIGMQVAKRVLLVGDHKQLPPFQERSHFEKLVSEFGSAATVRETDFQRALSSAYGKKVGASLEAQYRMSPEIGSLVSACFYDKKLETLRGESPSYYSELPFPLDRSVVWLDTSDAGPAAGEFRRGTSYDNAAEASTIIRLLKLLEAEADFWQNYDKDDQRAFDAEPIGIICMYAAQSTYLKREILVSGLSTAFQERLKIDTVDSYQGRENPIIILSLVRNNHAGKITQHAGDLRRVNVALSRAMERLVIVGSAPFFRREMPENSLFRVLSYLDSMQYDRIIPSGRVVLAPEVG